MGDAPPHGIEYEPDGGPSLFERWEVGDESVLPRPVAMRDPTYRALVASLLERHRVGHRLISVGAGNGVMEAELAAAGWSVLATDPAAGARDRCRRRGLRTAPFVLGSSPGPGVFDAVYCDGVLGHLWRPGPATEGAWQAMSDLVRPGGIAVVSNDVADGESPQLAVTGHPDATFYRPPPGWFASEAAATGRWELLEDVIHPYRRRDATRQREVVVVRSLVDQGVEAQDRPHGA